MIQIPSSFQNNTAVVRYSRQDFIQPPMHFIDVFLCAIFFSFQQCMYIRVFTPDIWCIPPALLLYHMHHPAAQESRRGTVALSCVCHGQCGSRATTTTAAARYWKMSRRLVCQT